MIVELATKNSAGSVATTSGFLLPFFILIIFSIFMASRSLFYPEPGILLRRLNVAFQGLSKDSHRVK